MSTAIVPPHVEQEINKYLILLAHSRVNRNSYFPAVRLPPELLGNIFTHCAEEYYESNTRTGGVVPYWVNVSYVCHHWREVALNCSALWAYHFTFSLRWTEELLARSKHASLKIRICSEWQRTDPCLSAHLEKLLGHMERIQELHLRVPATILPLKFPLRAPRLQTLEIEDFKDFEDPRNFRNFEWSENHPFKRTLTIDDNHLPLLRTLKLNKCSLPWQSLDLSKITTFFLCYLPVSSQYDIRDLLPTLAQIPTLEILHLEFALTGAHRFISSGGSETFSKISLPQSLTRLLVAAPISTVVAFLHCVTIPTKTKLILDIERDLDIYTDYHYTLLPAALHERFSRSKDSSFSPTIRSLAISFSSLSPYTLCASERDNCDVVLSDEDSLPLDCDVSLMITIRDTLWYPSESNGGTSITMDICCAAPLIQDVRTLHVVHSPRTPYLWSRLLGHFPGTRHLKVSAGSISNTLATQLRLTANKPASETRRSALCDPIPVPKFLPEMKLLTLAGVLFAAEKSSLLGDDSISYETLQKVVAARESCGPRIILTLNKCEIETEDYWFG